MPKRPGAVRCALRTARAARSSVMDPPCPRSGPASRSADAGSPDRPVRAAPGALASHLKSPYPAMPTQSARGTMRDGTKVPAGRTASARGSRCGSTLRDEGRGTWVPHPSVLRRAPLTKGDPRRKASTGDFFVSAVAVRGTPKCPPETSPRTSTQITRQRSGPRIPKIPVGTPGCQWARGTAPAGTLVLIRLPGPAEPLAPRTGARRGGST